MIKSQVLTVNGKEDIYAHNFDEIDFKRYEFIKKRKNKKTYSYCPVFMTFDIETSHNNDVSWCYQWALKFDKRYFCGRKLSDFIIFMKNIYDFYDLSETKKILIFVHNLSYEMQFLKHFLKEFDENINPLAIDAHSYISVDVKGFKFLCSYKLSNLSLDLFSKSYAVKYRKAVNEIDYSIKRYQDEELSSSDWFYQFSDVASQYDAIEGLMKTHGYKYAHEMPMTSTGFVRTDCRESARKELFWKKKFYKSQLKLDQYDLCKQAFMGGLTICSWKYSGKTVRGDIGHVDFTSSYPARQMMNYFPKGKPSYYGEIDSKEEFQSLIDTYCCVFVLIAEEVHIKKGITAPYIPSSKCLKGLTEDVLKVNGKVVYAKSLAIALTEIDYKCIKKQYDIGTEHITKLIIFERGEIPKFLKDRIMYYYKCKCELKKSDPRLYMASKALLNAIYGMTATAIIREEYKFDNDMILKDSKERNETIDRNSKLKEYYDSRNNFLPYQYSLYTTAWARSALINLIECVGYENFLYCDTDSVFYIKTSENEQNILKYNENIIKIAKEKGAYIGDKYLGYADAEDDLKAFRGLHAKCYACINTNNEMNVTIAGITKRATKWIKGDKFTMLYSMSNADELGNIDNLEDGFTFKHNGGSRAIYIETKPQTVDIDGHKTELSSGVIIEDIEKEISDTMFTVDKNYQLLKVKYSEILV